MCATVGAVTEIVIFSILVVVAVFRLHNSRSSTAVTMPK